FLVFGELRLDRRLDLGDAVLRLGDGRGALRHGPGLLGLGGPTTGRRRTSVAWSAGSPTRAAQGLSTGVYVNRCRREAAGQASTGRSISDCSRISSARSTGTYPSSRVAAFVSSSSASLPMAPSAPSADEASDFVSTGSSPFELVSSSAAPESTTGVAS